MTEFQEKALLDAARDDRRTKRCQDCKNVSFDMDGNFCGHPQSMKTANPFGQGLTLARSVNGVCGVDGDLWEGKANGAAM